MHSPAVSAATRVAAELRTGVWHGDEPFTLYFPEEWEATVHWPHTPPPLSDAQIAERLESPVAQPAIRELCRGKSRPLVIVDDLSRPTPVDRLMPYLLRHFQEAGIPPRDVRILIATGTHPAPDKISAERKIGKAAAEECQLIIHDAHAQLVEVGKSSFGTPVFVNQEVVSSDFVLGIGGLYPNFTAGFGGGSKLALGVLGFRSIRHLHYRHPSMGWGYADAGHSFRRDVDEIAHMINLRSMVTVQVNPLREVIRLACGDPSLFFRDELAFARKTFAAPPPGDADVVISNAYPNDLSLTTVHMKGITPLQCCAPEASRIVLAACSEGLGSHGIAPIANRPTLYRLRQIARRLATMEPRDVLRKIMHHGHARSVSRNRIWLYRPVSHGPDFPLQLPGFQVTFSWQQVLEAVRSEHPGKPHLRAVLYPCSPLQFLAEPQLSPDSHLPRV